MVPTRIQLKRAKGWRMPPGTVHVARPSRWSNPFRIGEDGTREQTIQQFERSLTPDAKAEIRRLLRGKHLACWCKPGEPCHADVLLRIANGA